MSIRFRKRMKIAPGVSLNIGKTGVSTTVGGRGASVNVGKQGVHSNLGVPGTGLSTRTKIAGGSKKQAETGYEPPTTSKAPMVIAWTLVFGLALVIVLAIL